MQHQLFGVNIFGVHKRLFHCHYMSFKAPTAPFPPHCVFCLSFPTASRGRAQRPPRSLLFPEPPPTPPPPFLLLLNRPSLLVWSPPLHSSSSSSSQECHQSSRGAAASSPSVSSCTDLSSHTCEEVGGRGKQHGRGSRIRRRRQRGRCIRES